MPVSLLLRRAPILGCGRAVATFLNSVSDTVQAFHACGGGGEGENKVHPGRFHHGPKLGPDPERQLYHCITILHHSQNKTGSSLPVPGSPRDLPADDQQVVEEKEVNLSEELLGPQGAGGLGAGHLLQLSLLQQPPGV